ncbi:hypothetical protein [Chondromyces crocatus]|uniref:hypothetical protein n=1 Tax=Chondromyces crocatus TaxID=52 RepID=UPI0012E18A38|nr:hypothetical protein [Chondromyces crocatus]
MGLIQTASAEAFIAAECMFRQLPLQTQPLWYFDRGIVKPLDTVLTVEHLVKAHDEGLLTEAELYDYLIVRAAGEEPLSYLDRIPERHRQGFAAAVENYPLHDTGIYYSKGLDPPSETLIRSLRAALLKKRST